MAIDFLRAQIDGAKKTEISPPIRHRVSAALLGYLADAIADKSALASRLLKF